MLKPKSLKSTDEKEATERKHVKSKGQKENRYCAGM